MKRILDCILPFYSLAWSSAFADEASGGTQTNAEERGQSVDGNLPESKPGDGPGGGEGGKASGSQEQVESGNGQAPVVSNEDLLNESRFSLSPEQEIEQLRTQYSASSREGQRLNANMKALTGQLEKQGISLVTDKQGRFTGIKATDKYSESMPDLSFDISELTAREKEDLADDPQTVLEAVAKRLIAKAHSAFTRVAPTADRIYNDISTERQSGVDAWLADRKGRDGTALYPSFKEDLPILHDQITDPTLPQAVKDAYKAAPELMSELFLNRLMVSRQRLLAWHETEIKKQKKENEDGQTAAGNLPSGNGEIQIGEGGASGDRFADFVM